jgi:hypothetical protein
MYNNRVYIIINKDLVTPEILEKSPNTLETARTDLSGNNIIIKYIYICVRCTNIYT